MESNFRKSLYTSVLAFVVGLVIPVYSDWSVKEAQRNQEEARGNVIHAIQQLYSIPYVSHHLNG